MLHVALFNNYCIIISHHQNYTRPYFDRRVINDQGISLSQFYVSLYHAVPAAKYISKCQFYSPGKGNNAVDRSKYCYCLHLKMSIKKMRNSWFYVNSARVHCNITTDWKA
jgi:hypothetical protein